MPRRKALTKRDTIAHLHRMCKRKSKLYAVWDNHPYSYHVHVLVVLVLFFGTLNVASQLWLPFPQSSYVATTTWTRPQSLYAATKIWAQTDWSGGKDGGIGLNPEHQTQWDKYETADPEISTGAAVTLASIVDAVTHDTGLSSGAKNNVSISSSSITLNIDITKNDDEQKKEEKKEKEKNKTADSYVLSGNVTSTIITLKQRSDFTTLSWKETL
ncbi:MAG: hypothetical protein Q7S16_04730, partial [bacterium]|nr:hypothetical protein [bacterium]